MVFGTSACATKKYVHQTVNPEPVRYGEVIHDQKKIADHSSAIGELENNVSRADEKATEAGRSAAAANKPRSAPIRRQSRRRSRADAAASMGEQNAGEIGAVGPEERSEV